MTINTALSIALLLLAGPVVAAPPPGMDIDKLAILLDLDEYQKQQVQDVLDARRTAFEAERAKFEATGERPDFDAIKARRDAAREETLASLADVLSPEQLEKFEILSERPTMRHIRRHDRPDDEAVEE